MAVLIKLSFNAVPSQATRSAKRLTNAVRKYGVRNDMRAVTLCEEGLTVRLECHGEQCFLEIADFPPTKFIADRSELRAVLLGIDSELANSRGYRCRLWREEDDILLNFGPARILYRSARINVFRFREAIEDIAA